MTLKFNGFKAKRNFHTILNFVLYQKYEMYENKYRTKICDFTVCRSGVPNFSTIDKTMKMLGAKAIWVVFRMFFFFLKEFFKKTRSKDEVQNDKQSWKI